MYSILSKFSICIIIPVCRNDVLASKGSKKGFKKIPNSFKKDYRRLSKDSQKGSRGSERVPEIPKSKIPPVIERCISGSKIIHVFCTLCRDNVFLYCLIVENLCRSGISRMNAKKTRKILLPQIK